MHDDRSAPAGLAPDPGPDPGGDIALPPDSLALQALIDHKIAAVLPDLAGAERRRLGDALIGLLGADFARFRMVCLAALAVDPLRQQAFVEYLRRRAAMVGRGLGPDEVFASMGDFERLPAGYIAALATPLPPPMPGPPFGSAASPLQWGTPPRGRFRLASWRDMRRELGKAVGVGAIAAISVAAWRAADSAMVGGALLVIGLAAMVWAFDLRNRLGGERDHG